MSHSPLRGSATEGSEALLRELLRVRTAGERRGEEDRGKSYELSLGKPALHANSPSGH